MRTLEPEVAPPGDDDDEPGRRGRNVVLGLGIAGFMLMALFWIAIFTGKFNGTNPDTVHDAVWVTHAGAICQPAANLINDLPRAQTAKSAAQRADTLDQGTAALTTMVSRLEALPSADAADEKMVTEWLADWRVYLGDRRSYAQNLRRNPDAKPLVSEVHGGWVTDAVDTLANANNLADCATPGDM